MTKKQRELNIELAVDFANELKKLASSVAEDVADSSSMTEAWKKIDTFYRDVEAMRNRQKCTGSKSFSIMQEEVEGHTRYLQGLDMPIMLNTIWETKSHCIPSEVSEMHIEMVDGKQTLLITPACIVMLDDE